MQYTMQIAAFAILAGLTQLTLGEYSAEQLGIQISTVTTAITNADDYVVNNVKTATGDLFVQVSAYAPMHLAWLIQTLRPSLTLT